MKFIRIILSGILALLVCVPICVCGDSFFPNSEVEHSCCPHDSEEQRNNKPSDNDHDCELNHHDQIEYIYRNSEPTTTKQVVESNKIVFVSSATRADSSFVLLGGTSLRAPPPDVFSHSTRSITYCIYRL